MKDFLGQDLEVGDLVVFSEPRYRNLVKGRIARFTPRKIVIEWTRPGLRMIQTYTIESEAHVVKVAN